MLVVIEIVNRVAKNIIILVIGIVLGENRNISSLIYRYITISTGINAISTETISLIPVSDTIFISNRLANISNNIEDMTINLKAPIVININNNKADQVICNNEEYPIKYYIYKEILGHHSNEKGGE